MRLDRPAYSGARHRKIQYASSQTIFWAASTSALRFVASNSVLAGMAPRAQWLQSYVTDDKIYCIYIADDADAVREHARLGGFPADSVVAIRTVIDPTTGETHS